MIFRVIFIWLMLSFAVFAVEPDEVLDDPKLEERARDLSKEIRCLVCQNEPIDSSDAQIAKDLRVLIRERIMAGDSDEDVRQFLVDRYGEFVLLKPRFTWGNILLWGSAPILFMIGLFVALRMPRKEVQNEGLSAKEKARLSALLKED